MNPNQAYRLASRECNARYRALREPILRAIADGRPWDDAIRERLRERWGEQWAEQTGWSAYCRARDVRDGLPAPSRSVRRHSLVRRRQQVLEHLPPWVRTAEQARQHGFIEAAIELETVEVQLAAMRLPLHHKALVPLDVATCEDLQKLRCRFKTYERRLRSATEAGTPEEQQHWASLASRAAARIKVLEFDEYEQRLRVYQGDRAAGRYYCAPRRPSWLVQEDTEDENEARERRAIAQAEAAYVRDASRELTRQRKLEAQERLAEIRRSSRSVDRLAHSVARVLDWARHTPDGLDLGNGWRYFDRRQLPYYAQRERAYRAAGVAVDEGIAFPMGACQTDL